MPAEIPVDRAIVVASHPRSGTHLVIDLLRRQFCSCEPPRRQLPGREPYWNLDELVSTAGASTKRGIARMARIARPVLKTHRRPDFFANCQYTNDILPERASFARDLMTQATRIYVYRFVPSVMKSLYAMVHPSGDIPFAAFIRERRGPWSRVGWWAVHLSEWMQSEGALLVCYEELISDPDAAVRRLATALGEEPSMRSPVLPPLPSSPHLERVKRLLSMRRSSTALISYRSNAAEVRPSPQDLQFMREEAARIDPRLPGVPRERD